jgi:hypothetical protein
MSGVIVNGFDVDTDHVADVLDDLADDIRRGKVHIVSASDTISAEAEKSIEYGFEMRVVMDENAKLVDYVNGRLIDTEPSVSSHGTSEGAEGN